MRFLSSDLTRNFAIGFAVGAVAILVQMSPDQLTAIPQAFAASIR
ncbi:hypothetical protein [Erythrobacter litoralis]|uniref:Uncharacterized protein n=1 Tax=Erythrobacter litoralis (strain HTCC2594) TaxID=314225 RepID=Q2N6U2_ERYLH|nr:hypothetical protein [Erythrobacter litoralis]ABC64599.1 hypothetical protein ELI_12535 [Erythrobacter litoralis HTCC2594]